MTADQAADDAVLGHHARRSSTCPGATCASRRTVRAEEPEDETATVPTDRAARLPRARDGQARDAGPHPAGRRPRPDDHLLPDQARLPTRCPLDLTERGFAAAAVHGDLGQGAREQALRAFRSGKVDVLVATDVAARGIDVEDVTHVVNYTCPEDEKTYLHRIGRTGRAGETGVAVTFVDWDELTRWEMINKALELPFPDPPETYSTSELAVHGARHPDGPHGTLPRAAAHPRRPGGRDARGPRRDRTLAQGTCQGRRQGRGRSYALRLWLVLRERGRRRRARREGRARSAYSPTALAHPHPRRHTAVGRRRSGRHDVQRRHGRCQRFCRDAGDRQCRHR